METWRNQAYMVLEFLLENKSEIQRLNFEAIKYMFSNMEKKDLKASLKYFQSVA